jgi:hypothetical protein
VRFDARRNRAIKATRTEEKLGYGLAHGSCVLGATPGEYLDRLVVHNRIFNDDVRLERVVPVGDKLSIITSQPWIKGPDAPSPKIDAMMEMKGFEKIDEGRYYHSGEGLLIHDLKPKNAKLNARGEVRAIDPVIQRVTPSFADFMRTYRVQS